MSIHKDIAIGSKVAVNKMASMVVSKGYSYTPNIDSFSLKVRGDTRIKPSYRTFGLSFKENQVIKKLIGLKFGSLTVLGVSDTRKKMWVVRCDCGTYTYRRASTICKGNDDACSECIHVHKIDKINYDTFDLIKFRTSAVTQGVDETKAILELVGKRINTFTVLGISIEYKGKWVIKCDCGLYSVRLASTIRKNPIEKGFICNNCKTH